MKGTQNITNSISAMAKLIIRVFVVQRNCWLNEQTANKPDSDAEYNAGRDREN